MSRKVKSVSFNLNDPFENDMYEYSLKFSSFSSFIKRLILNSLNEQSDNPHPKQTTNSINQVKIEQVVIEQEYLKQLI